MAIAIVMSSAIASFKEDPVEAAAGLAEATAASVALESLGATTGSFCGSLVSPHMVLKVIVSNEKSRRFKDFWKMTLVTWSKHD